MDWHPGLQDVGEDEKQMPKPLKDRDMSWAAGNGTVEPEGFRARRIPGSTWLFLEQARKLENSGQ